MQPETGKSITILIVEAKVKEAEALTASLKMNSGPDRLTLLTAANLSETLVQILAIQVDAILLDLTLPDSSGLETFRAVTQATNTIPVIILTGVEDENLSIRAVQMGAQDYLQKGIDGRLILQSVRYAIERKQVERLKQEFVATVSHELKTPLAAMAGALELLENRDVKGLKAQEGQLFAILDRNLRRLRRLIDDILDQRSLESGGMQFDPRRIILADFLPDLIEEQVPFAKLYSVKLELEAIASDLEIRADPLRCAQVINNLLSNAIKYTRSGTTVRIRCVAHKGHARFEFHDQGIGILEEHQGKIFEKLTRIAESNPDQREGTGLGLSITKDLVEHMKGRIDFDSRPGEGTCFWFELPLMVREIGAGGERRPIVLHLENDLDARALVETALKDSARVVAEGTLGAGMRFMNENAVDLVILDIQLGGESGLELLSYIEGQREKPPVLVFSAAKVDYPPDQSRIRHLSKRNSTWQMLRAEALRLLEAAPREDAPAPRKKQSVVPAPDPAGAPEEALILVVDDSPDLQFIVSSFLSEAGYGPLHIASSGYQALEALAKIKPQLILLDIMMPGMTGIELYHEIRKLPDLQEVPIAFMTARNQTGNANKLLEMGACHVFGKPFEREKFIATIASILQARPESAGQEAADEDEFARMRRAYAERLPGRLQEASENLFRYLDHDDTEAGQAARSSYHRLAGTAASYGFPAIGEAAAGLDDLLTAALTNDFKPIGEDEDALRELIERLDALPGQALEEKL